MCRGCVHLWEDSSVNAFECGMAEEMTEEQIEKYFCCDEEGCPFRKEQYEQDMDYINALVKHWK